MDQVGSPLMATLTALIQPVCDDLGLELVAVQFRREAHGQVLRVVIHHPDGVSVDDCARVSRQVGYILDVEDCIDQAYHLEVTSPGLDWPLTSRRDFQRYLGEEIKVSWHDDEGDHRCQGAIAQVDDETLTVAAPDTTYRIPLAGIRKARRVVHFGGHGR